MYYLLYKELSFLATLASMSFFKRSGTYNLDCFGRVGGIKRCENRQKIWEHMFFVCNYLNKNKFLLPYLQPVILFCTLTSKNPEISFLGYKVGKLIFSRVCV